MLEEAGLDGDVRLRVIGKGIIIEPANEPRGGWGEAAETLHDRGEHGFLDEQIPTRFDELEWEWE
ncbi:MAG: AbrB/MazE/SpoVT family DNA-binding domain-containing protein [Gemmatimonadota bacterium]